MEILITGDWQGMAYILDPIYHMVLEADFGMLGELLYILFIAVFNMTVARFE